jgi:hemin uptake protein HemP
VSADGRPAGERRADDAAVAPARPVLTTAALFGGRREILIRHGAEEYRLRITRANKLILTK